MNDRLRDRFRFRCFDNDIQKFVVGFRLCDHYKWPNGIIEQCTGLKDKNGKLIYEGDILSFGPKFKPFVTRWDNRYACFFAGKDPLHYSVECLDKAYEVDGVEVIGNIHEHGGLLNEN